MTLLTSIEAVFISIFATLAAYMPKLIGGIFILLIGLVVSSLLRDLILVAFKFFRVEQYLEKSKLTTTEHIHVWPHMLAELIRWVTIFLFLLSAIEVWEVPRVADVLGQLLTFLPNVFLAVVIGWIGLVSGRFAFTIVRHSIKGVGGHDDIVLASVARYSIIFFTTLIILNQLGVAAELVKILFTGIVGMLALALGLAFGLGGKDEARDILHGIRSKFEETHQRKKRKTSTR